MAVPALTVHTTDAGEACSVLQQAYDSDGEMTYDRSTGPVALCYELRQSGELHAGRLRHSAISAVDLTPVPYLLVGTVLQGHLQCTQGQGAPASATAGDVMLYPVSGARRQMTWDELDLALVRIPLDAVHRAAQEQFGHRAANLVFADIKPVTRAAGRQWAALSQSLFTHLAADHTSLDQAEPQRQLVDLLATTAVLTFPSAFLGDPHRRPGTVGAGTVRRAADLIQERATEPLTLLEIATVVGADPVALRQAFSAYYTVPPLQFLRRVRLELAYRELELGGADDEETVADVAARAGFVSRFEFDLEFGRRFRTSPEDVLSRGRAR